MNKAAISKDSIHTNCWEYSLTRPLTESKKRIGTVFGKCRKLALELHPDRNPGNHEAAAKFILVSKAYECLTDEKVKANCEKYGNPDGQ